MKITLKQLKYFIAAAEFGQISIAAVEVHVSQSAITTAIKSIESDLDTKLFDRNPHGVVLTYEGSMFLAHAKQIMAMVEEATRMPGRVNEAIFGIVKVAMSYTVAGYFIPPYLVRFAKSFPNIELQLIEASRNDIEDGLLNGAFDMAIMLTSNLINKQSITMSSLIKSRRRLWLSSDHSLYKKEEYSLLEVSRLPYIMLTVDEASSTALRYWNETNYQPNVTFRTSSLEAVRSMVANGMGVTILSDMVYRAWSLEGKRIDVVSIRDSIPDMEVGLAWSALKERNKATKSLCEFMHLAVASHP